MKHTLTLTAVFFTGIVLHAAPVQTETTYLPNAQRYIQKYSQQSDEPTLTLKEAVGKLAADFQTASSDLKSSLLTLPSGPDSLSNGDASEAFSTARQKIENVLSRSEILSSRLRTAESSFENSSSIPQSSKQELTQAITELRESCKTTVLSAQTELQNIRKTDVQITSWKKIYRYYNNLVGKDMASAKLKDSISSFIDALNKSPVEVTPPVIGKAGTVQPATSTKL